MTLKDIFDKYGQVKVISTQSRKIYKLMGYVDNDRAICVENRGLTDNYSHITVFSVTNNTFRVYQPSITTQLPSQKFAVGDKVKIQGFTDEYIITSINNSQAHLKNLIRNIYGYADISRLELINKKVNIKTEKKILVKKESNKEIEKFTEQTFEKFNFVTDW